MEHAIAKFQGYSKVLLSMICFGVCLQSSISRANNDRRSQIEKRVVVSVRSNYNLPQKKFSSPFWTKVWTPNQKFLAPPRLWSKNRVANDLKEILHCLRRFSSFCVTSPELNKKRRISFAWNPSFKIVFGKKVRLRLVHFFCPIKEQWVSVDHGLFLRQE